MKTAILTVGTEILFGQVVNTNAAFLSQQLNNLGYDVMYHYTVGDNPGRLEELIHLAFRDCDLILTTGGTGFSGRDITPEATLAVAERSAPGIAEYLRFRSMQITPKAMLSRGVSVMRGDTLIINLPGSTKAVKENLDFLLPVLDHGLDIMLGRDGECGGR